MAATTVKVQIKGEDTATELALDVAKVSIFIQEEMAKDTYSAETPVDLPDCVTPTNFAKVLKYCEHFVEDPMDKIKMPLKSVEMKDNVQEWYADFATEQSQPELFELITVANDLKIAGLMTLCSATVAAEMKKIPKEDLIKMFSAMGMLGGAPPGAMGAPPGLGMAGMGAAAPQAGGKKKSGKKKK
uniref:SKP1 component POZ domain-containing protein n=1 Tax=Leptocylindrus danicus TaxID=163516 RepID=A0A7S2KFI0_9STRA|mmetsp:Transcript_21761/g.32516  ORF Transcript_21761/g.32516 Transcript_21761/m.32516 type:complete len:186 (+) Transcript_21761:70-627(+)